MEFGIFSNSGKLKTLNNQAPEGQKLDDSEISYFEGLLKDVKPTAPHLEALWKALQWPKGKNIKDAISHIKSHDSLYSNFVTWMNKQISLTHFPLMCAWYKSA